MHPLYKALGRDKGVREHAYRELFSHHMDSEELHSVREALNQELVLGREDFKDKIEVMLRRQVRPGLPGRPRVEERQAIYMWLQYIS
jgi:putative transposase